MGLSIAREIDLFLERLANLQPVEQGIALRYFAERLPEAVAEGRLALIAELAAQLPVEELPHLSLGHNEAAYAIVASLPGSYRGRLIRYAQVQMGRLVICAFGDREKLAGEPPVALPAAVPLTDGISVGVMPCGPRNPQSGVILPELLTALSALVAVGFLWVTMGPLRAGALAAFLVCCGAAFRSPSKPVPVQGPGPVREVAPLSPADQQKLCAFAPGHGVPVAISPPRPRRNAGIWSRARRRAERGGIGGELLCALGCAAIVLVLCAVAAGVAAR